MQKVIDGGEFELNVGKKIVRVLTLKTALQIKKEKLVAKHQEQIAKLESKG